MSVLKIKSLTVNDQNEISEDEPYILVDGRQVWNGHMSTGDTVRFNTNPATNEDDLSPIRFDKMARISLWEDDGDHWYDRNDHLGTHAVYSSQAPQGELSLEFTGGGADYLMTYDIV